MKAAIRGSIAALGRSEANEGAVDITAIGKSMIYGNSVPTLTL